MSTYHPFSCCPQDLFCPVIPESSSAVVAELRAPLTIVADNAKEFLASVDAVRVHKPANEVTGVLAEQTLSHLSRTNTKVWFSDPIVKCLVGARKVNALVRAEIDLVDLLFFANDWYPDGLSAFDSQFFVQWLDAMTKTQFYDFANRVEQFCNVEQVCNAQNQENHIGWPRYTQKKFFDTGVPALIKECVQFVLLCFCVRTDDALPANLHSTFYREIAHSVLRTGAPYVNAQNERRLQVSVAFESMLGLASCRVLPAYVTELVLHWLWRAYGIAERNDEHQFWIQRCILFHKRLMQHCCRH